MPTKKTYLTATDQFCGAGGSSQGARSAGIEVKMAMNHWKLAVETHNTNFPDADHDCTDISAVDPRRYPSTDILITSPECTNHSLAKGVKIAKKQIELFNSGAIDPASERSRATMWDVPRFAEYHDYNAIIVENVVDARKWVMFDAWLQAMYALGYQHRAVYINSMHAHPTPQSRDRMYVVFWKKGNKAPRLDYTPSAWCPRCECDVNAVQTWKRPDIRFGKYRQQYVYCCPSCGSVVEPYYYAAFNCIDWTDIGTRIGDREKPLSDNTRKRIEYGLEKYAGSQFVVNDQQSTGVGFRTKPIIGHLDTITSQPNFKLIQPFIIKAEHSQNTAIARSVQETIQTQTTRQSMALVTPFITELRGWSDTREISKALSTVTAGGIHHGLVTPFLLNYNHSSKANSIESPLGTITTSDRYGIIRGDAWNAFIAQYYNGSHCTKHISQEVGTVTVGDRSGLVNFKTPVVEDCYYRMLKPHEIKLAMAFNDDYIVLGNSRQQVKQLGNAVTPPVMEWLTKRVMETFN